MSISHCYIPINDRILSNSWRIICISSFHLHVLWLAQLLLPGLLVLLLLLLMVVHVGLGLGLGGGGLGLSRGGLRACVERGRGGGAAGPRQRPGLGARFGGLRRGSGE